MCVAMRLSFLALLLVAISACSRGAPAQSQANDAGAANSGDDDAGATQSSSTDADSPPDDAAAPDDALASPDATRDAAPPPPTAYLTTDDLSQGLAQVALSLGPSTDAGATITIDPTTTYQPILGFGASITDSSSYVMTKYLSPAALQKTLAALFDAQLGVGLSFLRQPMGASDFSSVGNFSYDDGAEDPTLANFTITQDLKATVPVLKQVLSIDPTLFILGTPWSPPAWMKNNSSMNGTGGNSSESSGLAGDGYAPFGQYFVKFVQAYAAQGIPIAAVTPQNEPLNGAAAYPGMDLNAPSELALIAQDIGPDFKSAHLATLIWAYDHNWDVESYPEQIMADPTAGPFTEGAAFHCYGGDPSAMTTFHQNYPGKSVYMTECSGGTWQSDPFANTIDLAIDSTANWAQAVALWNMALDENAGPQNDGCNDCRGVITVNSQSGDVTYNADYFALGHFSKFVRPGARRIGSTSTSASINQVAFRNPDGRVAVVAHNTGSAVVTLQVGTGATAMSVLVPANAAVTVVWTPQVGGS
jgi:glucosylceramidase